MSEKRTSSTQSRTTKGKKKELPDGNSNNTEKTKMEIGEELFNEGKYIEAIAVFSILAEQGDLLARQYLARCYFRLDMYDPAYKEFSLLAESEDDEMRDYGTSMVAFLEMTRGNYSAAIKKFRALPEKPRNLLNLAIVYWKKYQVHKDEVSIWEALRVLKKIPLDSVSIRRKQHYYHINALIRQALKEYNTAESFYQRALDIFVTPLDNATILNDYASLYIERGKFTEAEQILIKARELIDGKNELEEAFNNKWFGIIALIQKRRDDAKKYLEKAVAVLYDKELLRELACLFYILADVMKRDNFVKAADYFAQGLNFEQRSEEVKDRDEKIIKFYLDSFFGNCSNTSGVG